MNHAEYIQAFLTVINVPVLILGVGMTILIVLVTTFVGALRMHRARKDRTESCDE